MRCPSNERVISSESNQIRHRCLAMHARKPPLDLLFLFPSCTDAQQSRSIVVHVAFSKQFFLFTSPSVAALHTSPTPRPPRARPGRQAPRPPLASSWHPLTFGHPCVSPLACKVAMSFPTPDQLCIRFNEITLPTDNNSSSSSFVAGSSGHDECSGDDKSSGAGSSGDESSIGFDLLFVEVARDASEFRPVDGSHEAQKGVDRITHHQMPITRPFVWKMFYLRR